MFCRMEILGAENRSTKHKEARSLARSRAGDSILFKKGYMSRPESIENRWHILYRHYPEVYEAFTNVPYHPPIYDQLSKIIDLRGKRIADVGAGTGNSSLALAQFARQVIGIEPETAMLRLAWQKVRDRTAERVAFLSGNALSLPLVNDSVDLVTGITLALYPPEQYRDFIREGLRVAKGQVVYLGIPPGWYGAICIK